jgi:hypothetical protein
MNTKGHECTRIGVREFALIGVHSWLRLDRNSIGAEPFMRERGRGEGLTDSGIEGFGD